MAAGVAWQPAVAHISWPCVRISSAYPPSDITVIRAIAIAKERPRPTCRIIRIGDGESRRDRGGIAENLEIGPTQKWPGIGLDPGVSMGG